MASGGGEDFVLVAAIDFGMTFSGYAFSFIATKDAPDLPEKIRINKSWAVGFQSYKSPTSVLTTKSDKFLDFGFDAEQRYSEAIEEDEDVEPDMILFRHFKMTLHNSKNAKMNANIASVDGTIRPAIDVTAHALRYLKDHMLNAIKLETGSKPDLSLIRWVITVPAIWSDQSKQFMRQAAFKAGCINEKDSKKLMIALEPEAASLCCRRMNVAQYDSNDGVRFPVGTKYLVLDCGGGTVDITAHETEFDKKVKELLHASGGAWGGTQVDRNFVEFMESILGKNFLNTYRQKYPQEWLQFLTNFEKAKKSVKSDGTSKISISLPWSMGKLYPSMYKGKEVDKVFKASSDKGVKFTQGVISINNETARKLFQPVMDEIVKHVRKLTRDPKLRGLRYILMVGGFSESRLLQDAIMKEFGGNGLKVLIPSEAQLAIIKGAVLFGHSPDEIKTRILRKTYGSGKSELFDSTRHDPSRKCMRGDGKESCGNIFDPLKLKNSEVQMGDVVTQSYTVVIAGDTTTIRLFITDDIPSGTEIKYTDEPDMRKVGAIRIEAQLGAQILLRLKFGATEIEAEAFNENTKKSAKTTIDFLH